MTKPTLSVTVDGMHFLNPFSGSRSGEAGPPVYAR